MKRVTCCIRPHQLEAVKSAIAAVGVSGMTVTDVRGTGNSPEASLWFGGAEAMMALPIRSRIEVVAADEDVEPIVEAILTHARTEMSGDGKIFIEPVEDALRVRTAERGDSAV